MIITGGLISFLPWNSPKTMVVTHFLHTRTPGGSDYTVNLVENSEGTELTD